MGGFDFIIFKCPKCGADIEAQSKGGECCLITYHADSVPADVASDANRHPIYCDQCGSQFVADTVPPPAIPKIALKLTEIPPNKEPS